MKPIAVTACLLFALAVFGTVRATEQPAPAVKATLVNNLSAMLLSFTQNMGQWPDSILFRANAGGATMWFTRDGIYYQFVRRIPKQTPASLDEAPADILRADLPDKLRREPDSIETMMIKAEFVGTSQEVTAIGLEELEYKCNYFIGNDPAKWRTDVSNYTGVTLKGIYPGVDIVYRSRDGKFEYELVAASQTQLGQVKVEYRGATEVRRDGNGNAVLQTSFGEFACSNVLITDNAEPITPVSAAQFTSSTNVTLAYSTYLGGGGNDDGRAIAVDGVGCAYVTGETVSSDFPATIPFDRSVGDIWNAFVTKLNPAGNGLVYSTYLGGSHSDYGYAIAVDGVGSAYVTGWTGSSDFPTATPFDGSSNGGPDAFVTKLSPTGNSLVYSTYLGGNDYDYGYGIAVDGVGSAYVTGETISADFPTATPFDENFNGGFRDAFVTKLSPGGNNLVYSTYLGGSAADYGRAIAVDEGGSAHVTGWTGSANFPTATPFDSSYNMLNDAFVTKLSPAGTSLVYSTFLGGNSYDEGHAIAVDGVGSAYVTGLTSSSDFPTTTPFDSTSNGYDAFVTKLSPAGNSLVYSTYLGGNNTDVGNAIAVDGAGSAYVTGYTSSSDFPTASPFDGSLNGLSDAFVTKLSPIGNSLVYSTYLGGSNQDQGLAIALDAEGGAYVTGETQSADFPTVNPFDGSQNSQYDAFVTKFGAEPPQQHVITILDGSESHAPIPEKSFLFTKVSNNRPAMPEDTMGILTTNDVGRVTIPGDWFSIGDMIKVRRLIHVEPARKHTDLMPNMYYIIVDNAEFDTVSGTISYDVLAPVSEQTITLDHTVITYDLLVSVEWDADDIYLNSLVSGIRQMSNYLYDVTDGQLYINSVHIFDDGEQWDSADIRILATNNQIPSSGRAILKNDSLAAPIFEKDRAVLFPRILYNAHDWYQGGNRNLTYGIYPYDWTIAQTTYITTQDYPASRALAHEFGHYGIGFLDEYLGTICIDVYGILVCGHPPVLPDYNFGFMDDALEHDAPQSSEMSSTIQYGDLFHRITWQWTERGKRSCWDYFEWNYQGAYDGVYAHIDTPTTQMFAGPNDDLHHLNYDVGSLMDVVVSNPNNSALNLRVLVKDDHGNPAKNKQVMLFKDNSSRVIDQGRTADNGHIYCLGADWLDIVRAEGRVEYEWFYGECTALGSGKIRIGDIRSASAKGDSMVVALKQVHGDFKMLNAGRFKGENSFSYKMESNKQFSQLPALEFYSPDGQVINYDFVYGTSGYATSIDDDLGGAGLFSVLALDDSANTFFVNNAYRVSTRSNTVPISSVMEPEGICELVLDTANSLIVKMLVLSSYFPAIMEGLDTGVVQVGGTYCFASYPERASLNGTGNYITMRYSAFGLDLGAESSLRVYRWDDLIQKWVLVGGVVDTSSNEVYSQISSLGTYTLFTARGGSCCTGSTGNVNASGIVDLSDLSALVSYLTGGGYVPPCMDEANVNNSGIVDLSDLSALVSYLTGGGYVLPSCP